jgi:hypothetical protein
MLRWWLGSCDARKRRSLWWKRRRDWRLWLLLSARRWVDRGVFVVLFSCAKVVAAENTVEREKEERELSTKRKKKEGGWLVFYQLFTQFSSHSGHGIHPYL